MIRAFLLLAGCLSASGILAAADSDFNGRWNIRVEDPNAHRAWWLEVDGAGTEQLKGRFVGAPGGGMDMIPELSLQNGELRFVFDRNHRWMKRPVRGVYTARLSGNRLEGSYVDEAAPDSEKRVLRWIGVRAPDLSEKDDGSWKRGRTIALFNGKDLSGWVPVSKTRPFEWHVKDGLMVNAPGTGDIGTEAKFWNFDLVIEYRIGKGSNSGVGLRGRYEVQIFDDHGKPPSKSGNAAVYSRIVPTENASLAPGEWQRFDIRFIGREVTVKLNGRTVIDRQQIEGLTAMASDPNEADPGPITLQGDHGLVEFRKIELTPLTR
jgi:hypothetical protein